MRLPATLRADMARLAPLWDGHAAACYSLPDVVLDQRQALDRLLGATVDQSDAVGVQAKLIADTESAAHSGAAWPSVDVLLDAELDRQRATLQHRVLEAATEQVGTQLLSIIRRDAELIIADHLRPALNDLLSGLKPHAAAVVGVDAESALRAGTKATKAWLSFDAGADTYRALRAGRDALALIGVAPSEDLANMFGEVRNFDAVWPDHRGGPGRKPVPPWPSDPRGRLAWFLCHDADVWLPTPAEQDERFTDWFDAERRRNGGGPRPAGLPIG